MSRKMPMCSWRWSIWVLSSRLSRTAIMRLFNAKINSQQLILMLLSSLGKKKARMEISSNSMIRTIQRSSTCTRNQWYRRSSLKTRMRMIMMMVLSSLKMLRDLAPQSEKLQSEGLWRTHLLIFMNSLKTYQKDSSALRYRRASGIYLKVVTRIRWKQLSLWGLYSTKTSLRYSSISLTIWMTNSWLRFWISFTKSNKFKLLASVSHQQEVQVHPSNSHNHLLPSKKKLKAFSKTQRKRREKMGRRILVGLRCSQLAVKWLCSISTFSNRRQTWRPCKTITGLMKKPSLKLKS